MSEHHRHSCSPSLYMMSNSALVKGEADFIFYHFDAGAVANRASPSVMEVTRRISMRKGAAIFRARPFVVSVANLDDFFTDLVNKDHGAAAIVNGIGRLTWLDIIRACTPWLSSISPSSSTFGTRATTESATMTSTALERTKVSAISKACSP